MSEGSDVKVVVDSREPEHVKLHLLDHPDVTDWMEHELDAADIVVNGVGFERKTPEDFASSLLEGRLDEQPEKMADAYDHAYLLIEGGFNDFSTLTHTRLKAQSARGKAARITADGIPVIPTGGTRGSEGARRLLIDMAVRYGRKHSEPSTATMTPTAAVSDEPLGVRLWACYDGIGPQRAEDLHREFGPPTDRDWDGVAPHDALTTVDGIGSKTAADLLAQLQGLDDE